MLKFDLEDLLLSSIGLQFLSDQNFDIINIKKIIEQDGPDNLDSVDWNYWTRSLL